MYVKRKEKSLRKNKKLVSKIKNEPLNKLKKQLEKKTPTEKM